MTGDAPWPGDVQAPPGFRCGFAALVGRTNVGKSTLINRLVGQKIAITSDKPETTRNRVCGVLERERSQTVLIDSPGVQKPKDLLNRCLLKLAYGAASDADLLIVIVEAEKAIGPGDRFVVEKMKGSGRPLILVLNKIDRLSKPLLLPLIDEYRRLARFEEIVPLSALTGEGVERLPELIERLLPEGERCFPPGLKTDQTESFLFTELIREKVFELTRQEVPRSTSVVLQNSFWEEEANRQFIQATIFVETTSQRGILIGRGGRMLKEIGTRARLEIAAFLNCPIYLDLRVKVSERWRSSKADLKRMGYGDQV